MKDQFEQLFKELKDRRSLKALYRKLSFENHPDLGGDTENMKIINSLYTEYFKKLKDLDFDGNITEETKEEIPEIFEKIISELIKLSGLKLELVGSWVWISGNSFIHRERLKELVCFWSSSKKRWYWNGDEEKKNMRAYSNLNAIKKKYGCVDVEIEEVKALNI